MKKSGLLQWVLLAVLPLFVACNIEKDGDDGVINSLVFKVDFADFNAEEEIGVSRSTQKEPKLEEQIVDLGNDVLALVSLKRDTACVTEQSNTRVLSDDTYTMLVYNHDTHEYKGAVVGKVEHGAFLPAMRGLSIPAGNYDFVLFNSKVKRSGNILTVARADANKAFLGRTTQAIGAERGNKFIAFTLKHAWCKIKVRLTGFMPFGAMSANVQSVNANSVPEKTIYDASTGAYISGSGSAFSANTAFPNSSPLGSKAFTSLGNAEMLLPAQTDVSALKLVFTSGSMFSKNIAGVTCAFRPRTPLKLEANGAYVLNVRLLYGFYYLLDNGAVGRLDQTIYGGGTRKPIALVVSRSTRLAVALENASANKMVWCHPKYIWKGEMMNPLNTHVSIEQHGNQIAPTIWGALKARGADETWRADYSTGYVQGNKVKGLNPEFYAFYAAAHYRPSVPYTGGNLSWHLPSTSDWQKLVLLGRAHDYADGYDYHGLVRCFWDSKLVAVAFRQVDAELTYGWDEYCSSTEYVPLIYGQPDTRHCYVAVQFFDAEVNWKYFLIEWGSNIRPFVNY